MARREIHNELDRENRNNHNKNYIELYEKLGSISENVSDEVFDMVVEAIENGIVVLIGKNSVATENIIDGQVTYYKTDFVEVASDNLINKDTILNYKAIREGTGELVDNNYHSVFADIPVQPNTSYACRSVHDIARVSFYDVGGDFLSDINNDTKTFNFETPDECCKLSIMIGGFSTDQAQLNLGNELKPYDDFKLKLKYSLLDDLLVAQDETWEVTE